ncbi:hypothetical protein [Saccharopolyspora mangrovi]|uniref:Uncharacterized protein n=1 Tax=Saccharopolyspora mangrovi TaxID=3082379 RepID=A0ABU6A9R9_9PSEU|nr:hypothetical protein [Saccharopolyspora sp. S2-29]MEB3368318.1 hypothetical protein [Saccharopolyspora sp. S2-29]
MADKAPGSDPTSTRARGQRDSGRYFLLPSETAERFRRDERKPDATTGTTDEDSAEDD